MNLLLVIVSGLLIGLISGLTGIGGGTMLVPLFVYAYKMNMYQAVGTSLAVIGPLSLVGAFSHHTQGNVQWQSAVAVALAAMVGVFVAGQIIQFIPVPILKKGFGIFLLIVAAQFLLK